MQRIKNKTGIPKKKASSSISIDFFMVAYFFKVSIVKLMTDQLKSLAEFCQNDDW